VTFLTEVTRKLRIAKSRVHFLVFVSPDLPVAPGPLSISSSWIFLLPWFPGHCLFLLQYWSLYFVLFVLSWGLLSLHPLFSRWCVLLLFAISYVASDKSSRTHVHLGVFTSKLKMVIFLPLRIRWADPCKGMSIALATNHSINCSCCYYHHLLCCNFLLTLVAFTTLRAPPVYLWSCLLSDHRPAFWLIDP
jgi:hypothetical protein